MVVEEDSNKSYPSMEAHHQMVLVYSIINRKITRSVEIDTYILIFEFIEAITFIEVVDLWKCLLNVS